MLGMAVKHSASVKRKPRGFMNILSSMASEWLLIFLLFVYAALSYLLTKLASYCELQTPCLLCSRLDHVFGEKPEFYRSLFCSHHRMEISSLIYCHFHGKLADARGMCEECLMYFSTQSKLKPESYKLLVGKLGFGLDQCGVQSSFFDENMIHGSLSTWTCSCCNKKCKGRSNAQRLLQLPIGFGSIKPSAKPPLPRLPGRGRLSRRESFKQKRDKILGPIAPRRLGNTGVDTLSHVGYTELKINSDSESEFTFSDDDDRTSVVRENNATKEVVIQHGSGTLPKVHSDILDPVMQTQQASDPGPSLLDQCIQLDVNEPRDVESLASDDITSHGLGELNWQQANPKPYPSVLPGLISLDDVPHSSNVVDLPGGKSSNESKGPLPQNPTLFMLSELVLPNHTSPSSNAMETPISLSPDKLDVIGTRDIGHKSTLKSKTTVGDDTAPSMSDDAEQHNNSKLSNNNKGREVISMVSELSVSGNSAKIHDQRLSAHWIGPSLDDTSPRFHGHHDESQISDASSSNGTRVLRRSPSMERNDSGNESLDAISLSEIEGESIVDKLKRQVEYGRRCMSGLYKELEEERNASAVATNQAMAMITRLQEEKASLHMEALQYLRMMEEQAEYDMEALEKANDLLAEKEKEVQDLEAELEFYRIEYPNEAMEKNLPGGTSKSKVDNMRFENNGVHRTKNNPNIKTSLLDFEGEKLYISQCLKKLERNLHQYSADKVVHGEKNPIKFLTNGETQSDHQKEENGILVPKGSDVSIEDNSCAITENHHFDSGQQESSIPGGEIDLVAVENHISDLNGRLEALEADRDLLEHALHSLKSESDGLQFVKEIAHQLQELRKIRVEIKCPPVP